MSTVDSKVVEAKFDNKGFTEGVKNTIRSLNDFSTALTRAAGNTAMDGLGKAADKVSNRFSLMRIAAVTAVATVASQATRAAERTIKAFTLDPITAGFKNYETQINAVQTILANTGLEGSKGLSQVNDTLSELNKYANQTVYNFSEMTKNIGTFTAAGVALKPAASAIKGIANLAALSGSSSDQASTAMYQLSQAIAANKVGLQDWNSVVNAGLGGKVFQRALFQTGATLHTIKGLKVGETFDQWTKAGNSFRGSLQKGWITGDVLTKTLAQFTGDMTDAQLATQGFNKEQIAAIQKMAKTANAAATNIKTVSQLKDALKEEVGTAYAAIFKTLFGDINVATKLLSSLHNVLENALTGPIYKINGVLEKWSKLGGRVRFIDAIKYAFKDLMSVITPINHAFRDIFPAETAKKLYDQTNKLEKFFQYFKLGAKSAQNLKETFKGVFAAFDIGITVIKAVAHFIGDLISQITKGTSKGGFLAITAHIAGFVIALDQAVKHGHGLTDFFKGIEKMLAGPIKKFHEAEAAVANFLAGGHTPTANDIRARLEPLTKLGNEIEKLWFEIPGLFDKVRDSVSKFFGSFGSKAGAVTGQASKLSGIFSNIGDAFKKIDFSKIGSSIANIAGAVGSAVLKALGVAVKGLGAIFSNIDFSQVLSAANTGLFAGLVLLIKKFLNNAGGTLKGAGGIIDAIKEPFEGLTGVLSEMQKTLKATILLEIATSIGILAAACTALAKINPQALNAALSAIGTLMAELFATLFGFSKIGGVAAIVSTATGMVIFAGAIEILTNVVKKLAAMKLEDMNKGLGALAKLIAEVVLAAIALGRYAAPMISGSTAMVILSAAIKILTGVVKELGKQKPEVLNKGLRAVALLLGSLALFSKFAETDKLGVISGAGIILLATGIKLLQKSVEFLGKMDIKTLRQGLISLGLIMAGFGALSKLEGNPATIIASAASMVIMAYALQQLIKPMQAIGQLSWEQIAKGLTVMAVAVGGIATALSLMPPTTVLTAAAIAIVAKSLLDIGNVVMSLGGMSWESIAKGLVAMAGALTIIGVAVQFMQTAILGATTLYIVAQALSVLAPVLTTLGNMSWGQVAIGLTALGGSLLVIGGAAAVLTPVIPSMIGLGAAVALLGVGVAGVGAGVFLLAGGLAAIVTVGAGAAAVIAGIVGALIALIPLFATKLVEGIGAFIGALQKTMPKILSFIQATLLQVIQLFAKVVPPLVTTVIKLLGLILAQLSAHAPKFFAQMVGLLLSLLNAVKAKAPEIVGAVLKIALDIVQGLAYHVKDFISAGVNIIVNILKGLTQGLPKIVKSAVDLITSFITSIAAQAGPLADSAFKAIITFINGLTDAVNNNLQQLIDAGENLAGAIVSGMVKGLGDGVGKIGKAAENLAKHALSSVGSFLGIASPSKEFIKIGNYVAQGFAIGITQGTPGVKAAWQQASALLNKAVSDSRDLILSSKDNIKKYSDEAAKAADKIKIYTDKINEASKGHKVAASTLEKYRQELKAAQKDHADATAEVAKYKALLEQATKDHTIAKDTLKDLNTQYDAEHSKMLKLATAYDGYTKQLDDANQKLKDLKTTRDDYIKSVQDEFNTLPDISSDTTVGSYNTSLTEQLADLQKFAETLQALRELGLDDQTYKLLLSKGPVALPFMEELLQQTQNGTGGGIGAINALDSQLTDLSATLGYQAGTNLYQAGIDAQQQVIDGIQSKVDSTKAAMDAIAQAIVDGLKQALSGPRDKDIAGIGSKVGESLLAGMRTTLGIHSPSKEAFNIGNFTGLGLIAGLSNISGDVANASENIGNSAKDALTKALSGIHDDFDKVSEFNPTLTPILDLTQIKAGADQLNGLLAQSPIPVTDAYSKALAASSFYSANQKIAADTSQPKVVGDVYNYEQNITSPKALSPAEIYRQTNNQLSVKKGALNNRAVKVS